MRRAARAVDAVLAFEAYRRRVTHVKSDKRVPDLAGIDRELERRAKNARDVLDRAFEDGLRLRLGKQIAPEATAIGVHPRDSLDMVAFAVLRELRRWVTPELRAPWMAQLREVFELEHGVQTLPTVKTKLWLLNIVPAELPPGIAVCEGCTVVFEPRRKAYARYCCKRCERLPRAPFLVRDPEPRGREDTPDSVPVRVRKPDGHDGTAYVGCCAGCASYFTTRRKDAVYCDEACAQSHRRAA